MGPVSMLVMMIITIVLVYFVIKAIKKTVDGFKE